jgi:hypothetical protein
LGVKALSVKSRMTFKEGEELQFVFITKTTFSIYKLEATLRLKNLHSRS